MKLILLYQMIIKENNMICFDLQVELLDEILFDEGLVEDEELM
jgi:hypothetical protein